MIRTFVAISTALGALTLQLLATAALAAETAPPGFAKLNSAQIRQAFVGRTLTDEVHFTLRYRAGGVFDGMSMGKKASGKWRVADDRLCETENSAETCYAIWKKAGDVTLIPAGAGLRIDGMLK